MSWRETLTERIAFGPSGGGGGGGSSQTVTNVQQIPQFEQQFAQENMNLARSLTAQPYPVYNGELVAGFTPTQQAGQTMAVNAANAYQPGLNAANMLTANSVNPNSAVDAGVGAISNAVGASPANPGVIQSYMSPFVQAALAPQVTALNEQLGQQQRQIDQQATGANAFGDARQGAASALANFYGNQNLTGLLGQGYNQAYGNALQTALQEQNVGMQGGQALANIGAQQQGIGLQGAQQIGNLASQAQGLGLQGANAVYDIGQQQQQLAQQGLNLAYQQYQNQTQWPYQQLNTRLSALSNSPYNISNSVTLPGANPVASNLGMFAGLGGLLGGSVAPFAGSAYNPASAKVG